MRDVHEYRVAVEWVGNRGTGTSGFRDFGREQLIYADAKAPLEGSADPTFHGNRDRWNPEEMLLAALAQCHMLSYLHMAVRAGVVVTAYRDEAIGVLRQRGLGGAFESATLRPVVEIDDASQRDAAIAAHEDAARHCFIANSVNFSVRCEPETRVRQ